jgi:hypothetical protein
VNSEPGIANAQLPIFANSSKRLLSCGYRSGPGKRQAVQLNDRATEDLPLYFAGLRADQILYIAPTVDTPIERVVEITRGQRLVLQAALAESIQVPRAS